MQKQARIAAVAAAVGGALALGFVVGKAAADQPHMETALGSLQAARGELIQAVADKGGYRAKAIRETDSAIADTKAGIAWAGAHH
jgi:hypothetical protein